MFIKGLTVLSFICAAYAQEELLVQTDGGAVQGHYNAEGIKEWMVRIISIIFILNGYSSLLVLFL